MFSLSDFIKSSGDIYKIRFFLDLDALYVREFGDVLDWTISLSEAAEFTFTHISGTKYCWSTATHIITS